MTTMIDSTVATQTYRVYIKATPEAIWEAITTPELTEQYGYGGKVDYELVPGGDYRWYATEAQQAVGMPEVAIDGEVIEVDGPRKLVQTWHPLFDEQMAALPATRITYEIEGTDYGVTKLTLTHVFDGAPAIGAMVNGSVPEAGGGWPFVFSDLKTLLETGKRLPNQWD
jgi:uncharacterized protein YndB with AHSA1/START domain